MEKLIIYPADKEQLKALKVFMKALKIEFVVEKRVYNPDFVAKIEKSRQAIQAGKGINLKVDELWK